MLLPGLALAKRAAPAKVEPVTHQGVRYIAPNDDGRRAYIEAWDVQTKKKLWDLTVFTNQIDPKLEEDVQHVFIKTLRVRDGTLIVTSERGETYRVDLKTKAVTQSEPGGVKPHCFARVPAGIALPLWDCSSALGSVSSPIGTNRKLRPRLPSSTTHSLS